MDWQLPDQRYAVVTLDPPWRYTGSPTKWGAAEKFYQTLSETDLWTLPICSVLQERAVVFLWATGPRLDAAIRCIDRWGLAYRGIAFVWVKTKQTGEPIGAQGVRPSIVKPLTEFVLAASTVAMGRPLPLGSEAVVQTVFAPKGAHSAKPVEVRERIDALYPTERKLDMFARWGGNEMWDTWGDESE